MQGSASLSTRESLYPRLLHASWFQRGARVERRVEHCHDVYHICIVEEGRGSVLWHGKSIPTAAGSLIMISPGDSHAFELAPEEDETYSEVTFELVTQDGRPGILPLSEILSEWTGAPCDPWTAADIVTKSQHRTISEAISQVVRACLDVAPNRVFQVNRALLRVIEIIAGHLGPAQPDEIDPLQNAANHFERDLRSEFSIQELAEQAGMSTNHFIRTFRERFGYTPRAFQHQAKISAARRLLSQTRYPIKLIAEWTGFSDVYYFSRLFTMKTGQSPAAYRKAFHSSGQR